MFVWIYRIGFNLSICKLQSIFKSLFCSDSWKAFELYLIYRYTNWWWNQNVWIFSSNGIIIVNIIINKTFMFLEKKVLFCCLCRTRVVGLKMIIFFITLSLNVYLSVKIQYELQLLRTGRNLRTTITVAYGWTEAQIVRTNRDIFSLLYTSHKSFTFCWMVVQMSSVVIYATEITYKIYNILFHKLCELVSLQFYIF